MARASLSPAVRANILVIAVVVCSLLVRAALGDCKCHHPAKGDTTRWGGNESVVIVPKTHFREISGTVDTIQGESIKDALVEVFDKPDYLVSNRPWADKALQKRLRSCVTSADGRFCFRVLPSGSYEVRVSKGQGWNVTHIYVVVDRKAAERIEPLHVTMHIGT
jgi:Carboxypeptidase regulatory-like domain